MVKITVFLCLLLFLQLQVQADLQTEVQSVWQEYIEVVLSSFLRNHSNI